MATVTISASAPSASINWAVLKAFANRMLEKSRRNEIQLGTDEYILLFEIVNGSTDGSTATGVTSQAVITYA